MILKLLFLYLIYYIVVMVSINSIYHGGGGGMLKCLTYSSNNNYSYFNISSHIFKHTTTTLPLIYTRVYGILRNMCIVTSGPNFCI